jgi:hypothetical protein
MAYKTFVKVALGISLTPTILASSQNGFTVLPTPEAAQVSFLWVAIGLAVLTSFAQGFVTVLASVAEDANMWTFRFRLAKQEHWWWTFVSALLVLSFITITLSFLAGNTNDALSVLALSSATLLSIVRYTIPAWRSRHFIQNRWLAWTGNSRTGIPMGKASICGDVKHWEAIKKRIDTKNMGNVPSDVWGPVWWPGTASGIPLDPAEMLTRVPMSAIQDFRAPDGQLDRELGLMVYDDGLHQNLREPQTSVSLLWGEGQGFRRRVSRGISSMPLNLLTPKPLTTDGYVGDGLCLAMGVLGRNKGLQPKRLVFDMDDSWKAAHNIQRTGPPTISTHLENTSTWFPRPRKVLRSYYSATMKKQYGLLGDAFVNAAVELALILADCPNQALKAWFSAGLEQQSMYLNRRLRQPPVMATDTQLNAAYRASYTSMIISLNYMPSVQTSSQHRRYIQPRLCRPDLHCLGLLLRAEGEPKPSWWDSAMMRGQLQEESRSLEGEWKDSAAWLLGLPNYPSDQDFRMWGSTNDGNNQPQLPQGMALNLRVD